MSGYALAADATGVNAEQQVRAKVQAQRDQLTGAAQVEPSTQAGATSLLDAPVDTDDSPTQAQQP